MANDLTRCGALTWTGEILDSLTTVTSTRKSRIDSLLCQNSVEIDSSAVLLGLRAYVLSGRSKFLLVVILTGALMRTALNFWVICYSAFPSLKRFLTPLAAVNNRNIISPTDPLPKEASLNRSQCVEYKSRIMTVMNGK